MNEEETLAGKPEVPLPVSADEKPKGQPPPTDLPPERKMPTTPAQEIRFNIPLSGVDEPYVILDTQERSPEARTSDHDEQGKYSRLDYFVDDTTSRLIKETTIAI